MSLNVHVSLHDVSPAFEADVDAALELAGEYGTKAALLVVPNFHGEWPLLDHPAFVARLRDLAAAGHEIYLHGFYHQSRPRMSPELASRGLAARLLWHAAQRGVSNHEAEFSDLTPDEAAQRLDEGARVLGQAGLTIAGFVPPAWSMPRWLLPMLAERGYRFCEDHLRIYDPTSGRSRFSAVLNYATRSPARLLSTIAYCRAALPLSRIAPARIAMHPGDMRYRLVRSELSRLFRH
ncbi:MAG TPA: polysaccharide deacetylase family protein, partial [Polyangiaceae bacterium]